MKLLRTIDRVQNKYYTMNCTNKADWDTTKTVWDPTKENIKWDPRY